MLVRFINSRVKKLKGDEYELDPRIPGGYLLRLAINRMAMRFRGWWSGIRSEGNLFVGRGVTLRSRSKITAGRGVSFYDRCYVDALSVAGIRLGDNVSIGRNTIIECTGSLQHLGRGMAVGSNVGLGSDNFYGCAGGIAIGNDTIVGNFVSFHAENHVHDDLERPIRLQGVTHKGITVGKNCWIGAKATILDGANIGDGSIIAAGALVTAGDYEGNCIYGGVPARLIKRRQ